MELELAQFGPEAGVVAGFAPRRLQLVQRRDQGFGHVAAAEVAVQAPLPSLVGVEKRLRNGRGSRLDVGPVEAGGFGSLDEEGDSDGVFARPRTNRGGRSCRGGGICRRGGVRPDLHPGSDVDAEGRNLQHCLTDVGRGQAAGQDDRDLARHGGGDPAGDLAPRPSGERASGGVENEALGAGGEVRLACLD